MHTIDPSTPDASTRQQAGPVRHALVAAGAPHNADGFKMPAAWGATAGGGHAKCSCGTVSDDLASTSARKAWHRAHKATSRP